jgi:predicted O-methyltransferase YrrM
MNTGKNAIHALREKRIQQVLDRLHKSAKADKYKLLRLAPRFLIGFLSGKGIEDVLTTTAAKDMYLPISPQQGNFIYQTAIAIGAKNIVEFGTSFGISTIYLASAIKSNGNGVVIGTELEPYKYEKAVQNLAQSGLENFIDIRLGDALETLKETMENIDMVLLDGWKDLYMPILQILKPRLRMGSIILADNIYTFKKALKPYVEYMQSGKNGFESTTLPIGDGLEYSVYVGEGMSG